MCLGIAGSLFLPSMRTKKISSKLTLPGAQLVTAESGSPGAEGGQCTGTLGLPAPWGGPESSAHLRQGCSHPLLALKLTYAISPSAHLVGSLGKIGL